MREEYAVESNADTIVKDVFLTVRSIKETEMNSEYFESLLDKWEFAAIAFRSACLAVKDPYAPLEAGGWNVHQVAAHTRDVHKQVYGWRAGRAALEPNPQFQSFDGEAYMIENYRRDEPLDQILYEFVERVKSLAKRLRSMPGEPWSRQSRHATLGSGFTLQSWVEQDLIHIQEHLETVEKRRRITWHGISLL
jgi:hypothetical protein